MVLKNIFFMLCLFFCSNIYAINQGSLDNLEKKLSNGKKIVLFSLVNERSAAKLVIKNNSEQAIYFNGNTAPNYPVALRFRLFPIINQPSSLILATAVIPGGSDALFITKVIFLSEHKASVVNTPGWETNIEGGVHIFELNKNKILSAIIWNPVFEQGESRIDPHRYKFSFYHWNGVEFKKIKEKNSKDKYLTASKAFKEIGISFISDDIYNYFPEFNIYR